VSPTAGRVLVVGSVNVDFHVLVATLPSRGETVVGGRFEEHDGGKGGNQAVAAARVGAATTFIGAVGDDDFGVRARAALAGDGVATGELATLDGPATAIAFIVVDDAGENLIAVASGANGALTADHVEAALERLAPDPGDVVLVSNEIPLPAVAAGLRAGRRAGATTVLNPAPATGLDAATVALADIVTPNEGELAVLASAGIGPPIALVSLGASGARLVVDGQETLIPALRVDATDTVGAGDTLNGVLAAGLAAGLDLEAAARRAIVAASLSVTRPGARGGMPTTAELEAALAAMDAATGATRA
jgi:ribokinase